MLFGKLANRITFCPLFSMHGLDSKRYRYVSDGLPEILGTETVRCYSSKYTVVNNNSDSSFRIQMVVIVPIMPHDNVSISHGATNMVEG